MKDVFRLDKTLSEKMAESENRPSGFDYLRLFLAISIIGYHTLITCYGLEIQNHYTEGLWLSLTRFMVPAFFSLSGFLIAGSYQRLQHLPSFLTLRALRILPALFFEVMLSAFLIGPLLTELPLSRYFINPVFFSYLLNVTGDIHYYLPGLFTHSHTNVVNMQLWTIPFELACYLIVIAIVLTGLIARPALFSLFVTLYALFATLAKLPVILGHTAICTFLCGMLFYRYRDKIPHNALLFLGAFVMEVFLMPSFPAFAALPVTYIIVYLGLTNPRKTLLVTGDYSYGLYLYGFVIQQAVYQLLPSGRVWYIHFPVSLLTAGILAWLSWTFIESKILAQKENALSFVRAHCGRLSFSKESH
jgi:peptidoglycan/LPS O-acetylase OafA/YrhL